MFKRLGLLILSLLLVPTAQAQFTNQQKAHIRWVQLLDNPGFESGLQRWTKAGSSTLTQMTTAANVAFGAASAAWTPGAASDTLTSGQVTIPAGLYGVDCVAEAWIKASDAITTMNVIDGSLAVQGSVTFANVATFKRYEVRFTCPSSGTLALQFKSSASGAVVYIDHTFLGGVARAPQEGVSNQVVNGNAEDNYVPGGWATYNDGAAVAPVDGTGGVVTKLSALSRDTTAQIDGKASFKMTTVGSGTAEGNGWAYSFTIPSKSALANALNDVTFDYYMDSTTTDLVRVYLYDVTNSTLITPMFTTCGGGTTPSLSSQTTSCHAELAWLASSSGVSYRLIFHVSDNAGAVTTAHNMWVDNLFVGQHQIAVGPQFQYLGQMTVTPSAGFGTTTSQRTDAWRIGNRMRLVGRWTNGTVAASVESVGLPTGYTIDTTQLSSSGDSLGLKYAMRVAQGAIYSSDSGTVAFYDGSDASNVYFTDNTTSGTFTKRNGNALSITSGAESFDFDFPVAQWAGGSAFGDNKVFYYYGTGGTWGTTSAVTTAQGPGGVLGGTTTPAGTNFEYTITPTVPIAAGSKPYLELSVDGLHYSPGGINDGTTFIDMLRFDGTNYIGAGVYLNSTGQIVARFGKFASGTGQAWGGTWYWRVVVASPGLPTAFGLATATTPGLYQAGQAAGSATNDTACAGCIGEIIENNRSSNSPNATTAQFWSIDSGNSTYNDGAETGIILTPGTWDVVGTATVSSSGVTALLSIFIGTAKGNLSTGLDATRAQSGGPCTTVAMAGGGSFPCWAGTTGTLRVKVATGTTSTYYLKGYASFSSGTVNAVGNLRATRVR